MREQITMAKIESTKNDYSTLIGTSGAGSVSSLTLNESVPNANISCDNIQANSDPSAVILNDDCTTAAQMNAEVIENAAVANGFSVLEVGNLNSNSKNNNNMTGNNNNNNKNNNNGNNNKNNQPTNNSKTKRRRRKSSKQKTNAKPYKKSNWSFQKRVRNGPSRLVPKNTNQFLMEEHMAEIPPPRGERYHDSSSFSYDSPNDKEEYLSKEFCCVYENARSERLYEMSKTQLIQEYLQLEASYEKLSNCMGNANSKLDDSLASRKRLKQLADRITVLTTENLGKYP